MNTAKLLKRVGDQGNFQKFAIAFVCLKWLAVSFVVFLPSYLLMTPTFTCGAAQNVQEIDACPILKQCVLNNPFTITAFTGLYCDKKQTRSAIISSQFFGSIVGLALFSVLADKFGRKIIIISTITITSIGSMLFVIGSYYIIIPLLFTGIILMGFGCFPLTNICYSFLSEISSDIWRQKSIVMTYSFWAIGQILIYPVVEFIQGWEYICFFTIVLPLFVLLGMGYFIVETPEFYYVKMRSKECLASLNYIARFNGKQQLTEIGPIQIREDEPTELKETFTKKQFLLPLFVISFARICNNSYYYTIQYSLDDYGYSFQVNLMIIGVLEFISTFLTNHFCHQLRRKKWMLILMFLSGLMGLLIEFTEDRSTIQLIFIGLTRVFNTAAYSFFSLISFETFPTAIRSTGIGITQAVSNFGSSAAPFLVLLAQDIGIKATLVGGLINIGGGVTVIALKETYKEIQEAKKEVDQKQQDNSDGNLQENDGQLLKK